MLKLSGKKIFTIFAEIFCLSKPMSIVCLLCLFDLIVFCLYSSIVKEYSIIVGRLFKLG